MSVAIVMERSILLDQLLELLQQVGAGLVQLHHLRQFLADGSLQLLGLRVLASILEVRFEGIEVDLAQVDE